MRVFFPMTAGVLGMAYALSGRVAEALPLMEEGEAEASAVRIFDTSLVAIALGTGYLLAGRMDEAYASASRAADMAERSGFRGSQARIARLLGEIAARRDPPEVAPAEDHYRRALALADELGMRPLTARCHLDLGRLHRRAGDGRQANEHVATATALYRDLDMPFWLEQAEAEGAG
jgi:tetratricopeptide (TPR) repeat protein